MLAFWPKSSIGLSRHRSEACIGAMAMYYQKELRPHCRHCASETAAPRTTDNNTKAAAQRLSIGQTAAKGRQRRRARGVGRADTSARKAPPSPNLPSCFDFGAAAQFDGLVKLNLPPMVAAAKTSVAFCPRLESNWPAVQRDTHNWRRDYVQSLCRWV